MTPEHPNPAPEVDEPALAAARTALADRRQGIRPPGGFDAWLHLLAAPVPLPPGAGGAREGAVRVATASLTAPNDPEDPLPLFFIAPARVEALLRRWLEELAAEGGGAGHGDGKPAGGRGLAGRRRPAGRPVPAAGTALALGPARKAPFSRRWGAPGDGSCRWVPAGCSSGPSLSPRPGSSPGTGCPTGTGRNRSGRRASPSGAPSRSWPPPRARRRGGWRRRWWRSWAERDPAQGPAGHPLAATGGVVAAPERAGPESRGPVRHVAGRGAKTYNTRGRDARPAAGRAVPEASGNRPPPLDG